MYRPYGWNGFPAAGDRKGRPYGILRVSGTVLLCVGSPLGLPPGTYRILRDHPHPSGLTASHLPPRRGKALRAGEGTRPYGHLPPSRGKALRAADSRPYSGKRARSVGSAKPGAVHKPQQRQFLQTQGPVARNETIKVTQILRAGNPAT